MPACERELGPFEEEIEMNFQNIDNYFVALLSGNAYGLISNLINILSLLRSRSLFILKETTLSFLHDR